MKGVKHILECHCILPQYRERKEPVYHKFVVFSEIDDSDTVIASNVQCNNCGTVHKIYDICKSEIVAGKDESASVEKKEDVALSLPSQLVGLLETYNLEVCDYQMARHIIENKSWGETIVLSFENEGDKSSGKVIKFLAEDRFRVESFSRQEVLQ